MLRGMFRLRILSKYMPVQLVFKLIHRCITAPLVSDATLSEQILLSMQTEMTALRTMMQQIQLSSAGQNRTSVPEANSYNGVQNMRTTMNSTSCLTSKDVSDDVLPTFDPGDRAELWHVDWLDKLEQIASSYEWHPSLLLVRAVSRLRGAAADW